MQNTPVHPEKIALLRQKAKDEFRAAASHSSITAPEGVAVLMASGDIIAGHTVSNAFNAALYTLSVHIDFAKRAEGRHLGSEFAIIAVAIATKNDRHGKETPPAHETMDTLRHYMSRPPKLTIHGVSSDARGMNSQTWTMEL